SIERYNGHSDALRISSTTDPITQAAQGFGPAACWQALDTHLECPAHALAGNKKTDATSVILLWCCGRLQQRCCQRSALMTQAACGYLHDDASDQQTPCSAFHQSLFQLN
ncbi:hypothetical protein, partial [Pseudomonas kielensis]|uniref:hypothetical protein n=1 Tax=Pseudomonas kielensis TaxID=2762577 RepID=UPI0019D665EA